MMVLELSSSGPGPRSGPAGPRTKDKDLDLDYKLNLVCHHPPTHHQTFLRPYITWNHYSMTSNHVLLILAIRMTFRTTFKTWNFPGVFKEDIEEDFEGYFKRSSRGCLRGTWRDTPKGTSNSTWKGTCCQAQVRSGLGLVQVTAQI